MFYILRNDFCFYAGGTGPDRCVSFVPGGKWRSHITAFATQQAAEIAVEEIGTLPNYRLVVVKIDNDEPDQADSLVRSRNELLQACKDYIAYREGNTGNIDTIVAQMKIAIANAKEIS